MYVPPHFAELLAAVWEQRLTTLRDDRIYNYEQHQLGEHWVSADNPDGRDITEECMLVACDDGVFDVDARFCDHYSDGRMTVCELRIRLHDHDNERNPT